MSPMGNFLLAYNSLCLRLMLCVDGAISNMSMILMDPSKMFSFYITSHVPTYYTLLVGSILYISVTLVG